MTLRLMRVCVCGHGREDHHNPHAVKPTDPTEAAWMMLRATRCQWVKWTTADPNDARAEAICHCTWWRPVLFPRLRNVPMEHPS